VGDARSRLVTSRQAALEPLMHAFESIRGLSRPSAAGPSQASPRIAHGSLPPDARRRAARGFASDACLRGQSAACHALPLAGPSQASPRIARGSLRPDVQRRPARALDVSPRPAMKSRWCAERLLAPFPVSLQRARAASSQGRGEGSRGRGPPLTNATANARTRGCARAATTRWSGRSPRETAPRPWRAATPKDPAAPAAAHRMAPVASAANRRLRRAPRSGTRRAAFAARRANPDPTGEAPRAAPRPCA
jgi:hypothetical protein